MKARSIPMALVAAMANSMGLSLPGVPAYRQRKTGSIGARGNRSRHTPHQGKQEIARRKRQGVHFSQWKPFVFPVTECKEQGNG